MLEKKEVYSKWKRLVNMSKSELQTFFDSADGKKAGLSAKEAKEQGINSGRESARWILKMKSTNVNDWTPTMWKWAKKQISFISRMSGVKGDLYDKDGNKTRKHLALLIWGHNPKKYADGGSIVSNDAILLHKAQKADLMNEKSNVGNRSKFYKWFIEWYKPHVRDINIMISYANYLRPEIKGDNVVVLELFEKVNQSINAKEYLKEILDKADQYGVTIYLYAEPSHKHIKDEKHKEKINKQYIMDYYKNFGFKSEGGDLMSRKYKKGGTISQTPAPFSDKIKGSKVNKVGSATSEGSSNIELSNSTIEVLKGKLDEFKKSYSNNDKITLNDLKAVYRRGSGAYSTSHRPNITRAGWSYARVNKFLEKAAGKKVKAAYVQDDDLLKYENGGLMDKTITCMNCGWHWLESQSETYDKYVCHKCGFDNWAFYETKYDKGGLTGLDSTHIDTKLAQISKKFKVPLSYIKAQLKDGLKAEGEHTKDKSIAAKIALDHLAESPYYYQKLQQMEKELETMNADKYLPRIMSVYENGGTIDMIYKLNTPSKEPTKLNYIQQVLVRTTEFKKWFGDWETAAKNYIADNYENFEVHYKNCSKVIDLTTYEPSIEYHGSNADAEFYKFNVTKEQGLGRPYGYFADNVEYSQNFTQYSQRGTGGVQLLYKCFLKIDNPFFAIGGEFFDRRKGATYWLHNISGQIFYQNYKTVIFDERFYRLKEAVISQIGSYVESVYTSAGTFWLLMARDVDKIFKTFLISHGFTGVRYAEEFSANYDVENRSQFTRAWTVFDAGQIKLADGRNIGFDPFNKDIRFEQGGETSEPIETKQQDMTRAHKMRQDLGLDNKMFADGGTVFGDGKNSNNAKDGGYFKGQSHANGGIKAINKDTGQMLEVEGDEVIINKRSVADTSKKEFEGKMLTNKEILSKINQMGGGVAFADGGEINEKTCGCMGKKYKFGGELVSDYEIVKNLTNNAIFKPLKASVKYVKDLITRINK